VWEKESGVILTDNNMATRFYLTNSGTVSVSPAFSSSGAWSQTGEADRMPLILERKLSSISTLTDKQVTVPITDSNNILNRQFISEPIAGQVISGTLSCVIRCSEDAATTNVNLAVVAYLVNSVGTLRSIMLNNLTGTEFDLTAGASTRIKDVVSLTSRTAQNDDRIVIEIGVRSASPSVGGSAIERFGTSGGTDFALTSGLTTDLNPWVEFSQDIIMSTNIGNYPPYIKVGNGMGRSERAT